MKKIRDIMVMALLVSAISLSSCGKKHCHKPEVPKAKPECHHPEETTETEGE